MKIKTLFFLFMLAASLDVRSQASVTGPSCVLPGVEYEYLISTTDTAGAGIHICLSGGVYADGGSTCIDDKLVSYILVTWNTEITTASITINSPAGDATDFVNITSVLEPGLIDTAYLQQAIDQDSFIAPITCPAASGGNCSPSYSYQWQQSPDNLSWDDIAGATNQDLDLSIALTQTSYFRRKVTEMGSGSIGYSNAATVYVNPASNEQATEMFIIPNTLLQNIALQTNNRGIVK